MPRTTTPKAIIPTTIDGNSVSTSLTVLIEAAYLGMLYTLFLKRSEAGNSGFEWFVLVTWSAFPLVWVLAPTGFGVVTTYTEAILYGALDLLTKIFFGTYLIYRSIK
jgi:sensory rhodopsin